MHEHLQLEDVADMHGLRNPGPFLLDHSYCARSLSTHTHTRKRFSSQFQLTSSSNPITSAPPVTASSQIAALEPLRHTNSQTHQGCNQSSPQSSSFMPPDQQTSRQHQRHGTRRQRSPGRRGSRLHPIPRLPASTHASRTDATGSFNFTAVNRRHLQVIEVISPGFASWVSSALILLKGQHYELPTVYAASSPPPQQTST